MYGLLIFLIIAMHAALIWGAKKGNGAKIAPDREWALVRFLVPVAVLYVVFFVVSAKVPVSQSERLFGYVNATFSLLALLGLAHILGVVLWKLGIVSKQATQGAPLTFWESVLVILLIGGVVGGLLLYTAYYFGVIGDRIPTNVSV